MRTGTGAAMNAVFCLSSVSAVSIACRSAANIGFAAASSSSLGVQQFETPPLGATRRRLGSAWVRRRAAERQVGANRKRRHGRIGAGVGDAAVVAAANLHRAAVGAEGAVGAADGHRRRASPGRDERRPRHHRRLVGAERPELIVAAGIQRQPFAARSSVACPPAATSVIFSSAGRSATLAGAARLAVVSSHSCDLPLLPQSQTLPSARTAALCHVPAANDTTSVRSAHARQRIGRAAVAQLTVAAAAKRVERAVLRQRQGMKGAGLHGGDLARQVGERERHERLDAAALGSRTLPHRVVAGAIEVARARKRDAEAVPGRDVHDRLVGERLDSDSISAGPSHWSYVVPVPSAPSGFAPQP